MSAIFKLRSVEKQRDSGNYSFRLQVPELDIRRGERIALVGESGCGKSTLLDLLVMVLKPSAAATFEFNPRPTEVHDIAQLWARGKRDLIGRLRSRYLGYVMQSGGLLPFMSVYDNIALPRRLLDLPRDDTIRTLAATLGIEQQLAKYPGELSVGERQRVAIARAIAHRPDIVIADEPTAAVDEITARRILGLFLELVDAFRITLIIASHNLVLVERMQLRPLSHRLGRSSAGNEVRSVFSNAE